MRLRFQKPTVKQRSALVAQLARLQDPDTVTEILRSCLPSETVLQQAVCTPQSRDTDRFVIRVETRTETGERRVYAFKVYMDDRGRHIWAFCKALAVHWKQQQSQCALCAPLAYIPRERMLIFPWLEGVPLSRILDEQHTDLLEQAALVAATLHRSGIAPEAQTTAQVIVEETLARSERLCQRWAATTEIIEPLMATLIKASTFIDPSIPGPVHGDMAPDNFLWTEQRLILLDLDMFGYTDPAYDAGHFLAQLQRQCLLEPKLQPYAAQWLATFRTAYLAAMPVVSARNVAFYHGLTLIRKIYTVCRQQPAEWPLLVPQLAHCAQVALQEVMPERETK